MRGRSHLVLSALLVAACGGGPRVEAIELVANDNPTVPMAARLSVRADRAVRVRVSVSDEYGVVSEHEFTEPAQEHELPVLGFHPGREHTVDVTLTDEAGRSVAAEPLPFRTDPLPAWFPPIQKRTIRRGRMEPGYTFVPLFRGGLKGPLSDRGLVVALDAAGDVVWWYAPDHIVSFLTTSHDGHLLYLSGSSGRIVEADRLGNVLRRWHTTGLEKDDVPQGSIPIETDSLHHDLRVLDNGNFMALSSELRRLADYPTSQTDPDAPRADANVVGDVLIEFTQAGEVVREWSLMDVLDPYRVGPGSLNKQFWGSKYEEPIDFAHMNSIDHDPRDDSVVLSTNNQCAVFEMDLGSGEIQWILGRHEGWKSPWREKLLEPEGELLWPANQHAAMRTERGTILLYDNGRHRTPTFEPPEPKALRHSRVVEYEIDEERRTVREVWSYGSPDGDHYYSEQLCDVDVLPRTGNVYVTDGERKRDIPVPEEARAEFEAAGQAAPEFLEHSWVHLFEVTRSDPPEKVWEIVIDESKQPWSCYRSERLPTLYRR